MSLRNVPIALALAAGLVVAGCRSRSTPPPNAPGGSTSEESRKDGFRAAVKDLSDRIHADKDAIVGVSQDDVTWNDSCLGCPRTGQTCTQIATPGYRIILRAGDATYEYHTDLGGRARFCEQNPPGSSYPAPGSYPPPTPTPYL